MDTTNTDITIVRPVAADCIYEPDGLLLPDNMSFGVWSELLKQLQLIQQGSMWWLGDALLYGEKHFGDDYYQAASNTGYAPSTVEIARLVASKFEPRRRHSRLGWSHHLEVVGLNPEDQDRLLDEAEGGQWTTQVLRQHVRAARTQKMLGTQAAPKHEHLIYAEWRDHDAALRRFGTKYPKYEEHILQFTAHMNKLLQQALLNTSNAGDGNASVEK